MSDPISDIKEAIRRILNERWICRNCGYTTFWFPQYASGEIVCCFECHSYNWYYTIEDIPEI